MYARSPVWRKPTSRIDAFIRLTGKRTRTMLDLFQTSTINGVRASVVHAHNDHASEIESTMSVKIEW